VPSLTIATARADQLDAIGELTVAVYRGDGFSPEEYEPQLRAAASRAETATVLAAELDGRLVGAVTVATRGGEWAEQAVPGEAVVRMLVVDPAARGAGVGEALVRGCLEAARTDGCTVVRLSTKVEMTTAHRIYERLGFVRRPDLDQQWGWITGWAFVLDLAAGKRHPGS
jgi:ribosomal protein S18 acetylase RimI-like enzyme